MRDTLYEQLYQHSSTAILSVDRQGQVVDCNRCACQLLARGRDELLGTPLLTWIAAPERRPAKARFLRALEGRVIEWHSRVVRPRGAVRAVMMRAVPHGGDVVSRIDTLVWDAARVAQRTPAEALAQVLESTPGQFAVVLDAEETIRYCVGMSRTHWRNDADLLGNHVSTLLGFGAESRKQLQALRQQTSSGRTWTGQQVHQRADGAHIAVELHAVPVLDPSTGAVASLVLAGRDITDVTELRARVLRAERLAKVAELSGGLVEELQSALPAIRAAVALSGAGDGAQAATRELDRADELLRGLQHAVADAASAPCATDLRDVLATLPGSGAPGRVDGPGRNPQAVPLVLRSLSVLLVEDDTSLRSVLRTVLERAGYSVTEAFSGRSALAALGSGRLPDLLVTDLKMSGGTGYWLMEKLRSEYPSLLERTVVLTGEPSDARVAEITARTGCPVARKPLEFHVLLEIMDELALRVRDRARAAS